MKIGIVTITNGANYGNRLQNYALQYVLKELNHNVETLRHITYQDIALPKRIIHDLKIVIKIIIGRKYNKHIIRRNKRFRKFNKDNICFSNYTLHKNVAPKGIENSYDRFIVGSDQVWNAGFRIIREDIENYLLCFAKPEQRIAYAASFGTNSIEEGYEEIFASELSKFRAISVRETAGLEIVRKLGYNACVTLDPVMLLTKEQWTVIAKKPTYIKEEPYILTYFLSERNEQIDNCCKNLASKMRVVNLDIEDCPEERIKDIDTFSTAPDEFVWLISHAEYILTDSFHATAFSIIFHKPFWVFERKRVNKSYEMGSRITTLLETFELLEHKRSFSELMALPTKLDSHLIDEKLRVERQKSIHYLKEALR